MCLPNFSGGLGQKIRAIILMMGLIFLLIRLFRFAGTERQRPEKAFLPYPKIILADPTCPKPPEKLGRHRLHVFAKPCLEDHGQ